MVSDHLLNTLQSYEKNLRYANISGAFCLTGTWGMCHTFTSGTNNICIFNVKTEKSEKKFGR